MHFCTELCIKGLSVKAIFFSFWLSTTPVFTINTEDYGGPQSLNFFPIVLKQTVIFILFTSEITIHFQTRTIYSSKRMF